MATDLAHKPGDGSKIGPAAKDSPARRRKTRKLDRETADALLYFFADQLNDIEQTRIAATNRLRSMFHAGINQALPEVKIAAELVEQLQAVEHQYELRLNAAMRLHYLGPWQKDAKGVGEKQLGRLLASIGDPAARQNPRQLYRYCGLHVLHPDDHGTTDSHRETVAGVAPSRTRGQRATWNHEARMRIWLIAKSIIMQKESPYRRIYDEGRARYAEAVHVRPCVRCGPSGKPAPAGSPLSDGHQHARAQRLVMKRVLKDIWREARRTLQEEQEASAAIGDGQAGVDQVGVEEVVVGVVEVGEPPTEAV